MYMYYLIPREESAARKKVAKLEALTLGLLFLDRIESCERIWLTNSRGIDAAA